MIPHSSAHECDIQGISLNRSEVESCVEFGSLYDVCGERCLREYQPYPFSSMPDLEEPIYGKIFPVLVFFVVVANVMVAVVLSKRHMITPTNVVLKYMAIADLFVGLTPLPWTVYYFTLGNMHHMERMELWWCKVQKMSMDAFPPVFHNVAMWLTVLLAGQRFISISYPLYSRTLCNVRNVRIATVIIGVISILCGLPKSFDFDINFFEGYLIGNNATAPPIYSRMCLMRSTDVMRSIGENLYFSVYFWTRSIVFVVLPSILLIGLNAGLIRGIQKAKKRKQRLLKEKRTRDAQRATDTNSTSLMLVVIVSIFLMVNLPQAFFMVMICIMESFPGIQLSFMQGRFPVVFLLVNNMLVMATYPINFAIYCFMSSSFRQTFRALFCRHAIFGENRFTESSVINERKLDNSVIPLVKYVHEDGTTANDENGNGRQNRRNNSVYL